ncbi:MAG: hypothetical protein M3512_05170, partial [Bacteroidota bacterium]|nr:hypothetical protein [Bacteroidota bacterium]
MILLTITLLNLNQPKFINEEVVQDFIQIVGPYFVGEIDVLIKVLHFNYYDQNKLDLIFNGQGIQLADAFKQ